MNRMKNRKLKTFFGMAVYMSAALCLSACGNTLPEMTEEQNAQVVEYAAGLLLKYDENYDSRLVELKEEDTREQENESAPEEPEPLDENNNSSPAEETVTPEAEDIPINQSIDEFFGIEDITIQYTGLELRDVYSVGEAGDIPLAMTATRGSKLVVLNFEVINHAETDKKLDMITAGAKFKISINGDAPKYALTTMLPNDLASYNESIPAGGMLNLVLVAEIPDNEAETVESVSLIMRNVSGETTTSLN